VRVDISIDYLLTVLTRNGLKQMVIVNVIFGYVGVGFVATQIALFAECRPFSGYWSVPAIDGE
jgi:hypothetical protein